jgi:hypothetical protein
VAETTKRAYTLRLAAGAARDAIWRTHEALNNGTRAFGDWLLTIRGGVPAPRDVADARARRLLALCWFSVESAASENERFRVPHEDRQGGQGGRFAIATAIESAFRCCLASKGIDERDRDGWWADCRPALTARIHDDAVWVERWRMFEEKLSAKPEPKKVDEILRKLVGRSYIRPAQSSDADGEEEADAEEDERELDPTKTARNLCCQWFGKGKGVDFAEAAGAYEALAEFATKRAMEPPESAEKLKEAILAFRKDRGWRDLKLKTRGRGSDKVVISVEEPMIGGPGDSLANARKLWNECLLAVRADSPDERPSPSAGDFLDPNAWEKIASSAREKAAEKAARVDSKGETPWGRHLLASVENAFGAKYADDSGGKANTDFFYVMFGLAARRLSQGHSWIRRAEAARDAAAERERKGAARFTAAGPREAMTWLDGYLDERGRRQGAVEPIRIRREAISGWEAVVAEWSRKECVTALDRIEAIGKLQDGAEKFGDASLFKELAADQAICVWRDSTNSGAPDPTLLSDYVAWKQAEYDARRFKVPRYCHPDPLDHPVFGEFGASYLPIRFGWQAAPASTDLATVTRVSLLLLKAESGAQLERDIRWQSRRLLHDLGFGATREAEISRATRLGHAAIGESPTSDNAARPAALFGSDPKPWNARLQARREELAKVAWLERQVRDSRKRTSGPRAGTAYSQDDVRAARERIRWFLTFSPDLVRTGPWLRYVEREEVRRVLSADDAPVRYNRKRKTWTVPTGKEAPGWIVRPGLGVLPGVRVMGVDLGHRHGATCAVWQQVSSDDVAAAAREANLSPPGPEVVSFRCREGTSDGGHGRQLLFRRVGDSQWARLERRFAIRLPGEEREPRRLFDWELAWIFEFIEGLGYAFPRDEDESPEQARERWLAERHVRSNVARARIEILRIAERALRRHGDLVRIAHAMTSPALPGAGGTLRPVTEEDRVAHVTRAMALWDGLVQSDRWKPSDAIIELWRSKIVETCPGLSEWVKIDDEASPQERKAARAKRESLHQEIAQVLAPDERLRHTIASTFFEAWRAEDAKWKIRLRALADWIARGRRPTRGPDGKPQPMTTAERRFVGGLSIDRIDSLERLSRLQRAFSQRPDETTVFHMSKRGDTPARAVRDKMERLREDRLKKLANAIAMSALGLVGTEADKRARIEKAHHAGPRFAPVEAIAIESLRHYRPDAARGREENRRLMAWSARELAKRLGEACDLHGLLLVEVTPSFTSRLCSHCGGPGIRCEDLQRKYLDRYPYWRRERARALKRAESERDALQAWLAGINPKELPEETIRIPKPGASVFVCANDTCDLGRRGDKGGPAGLQADLNAAANIALRAMMDGRAETSWVYLPSQDGRPALAAESLRKAPEALRSIVLVSPNSPPVQTAKANAKKSRRAGAAGAAPPTFPYLFRDVSRSVPLANARWEPATAFFNFARKRVVERLQAMARTARGASDKQPATPGPA